MKNINVKFNTASGRYVAHVNIDGLPHVISCGPGGQSPNTQPVTFLEGAQELSRGDRVQIQGRRFRLVPDTARMWGCRLQPES